MSGPPPGLIDHRSFVFPIFTAKSLPDKDGVPQFEEGVYMGTGFLLRKAGKLYFVTAAHVVEARAGHPTEGYVFYFGRPGQSGKDLCGLPSFQVHPKADLAYVELAHEGIEQAIGAGALRLAAERLLLGDWFLTAGYPFTGKTSPDTITLSQFVFKGYVTSRVPKRQAHLFGIPSPAEWTCFLSTDAVCGLSGAPVLRQTGGSPEVVGVIMGGLPEVTGVITGSKGVEVGEQKLRFGTATELDELREIGVSW